MSLGEIKAVKIHGSANASFISDSGQNPKFVTFYSNRMSLTTNTVASLCGLIVGCYLKGHRCIGRNILNSQSVNIFPTQIRGVINNRASNLIIASAFNSSIHFFCGINLCKITCLPLVIGNLYFKPDLCIVKTVDRCNKSCTKYIISNR